MTATWAILGIAALYCLVRGLADFQQRRFAWGIAGLLCASTLLLTPIPSQAVKVDVPQAPTR
jgi:hypothetical protein